jgi:hypothetical protein
MNDDGSEARIWINIRDSSILSCGETEHNIRLPIDKSEMQTKMYNFVMHKDIFIRKYIDTTFYLTRQFEFEFLFTVWECGNIEFQVSVSDRQDLVS